VDGEGEEESGCLEVICCMAATNILACLDLASGNHGMMMASTLEWRGI
jgi:hypothetical protein